MEENLKLNWVESSKLKLKEIQLMDLVTMWSKSKKQGIPLQHWNKMKLNL